MKRLTIIAALLLSSATTAFARPAEQVGANYFQYESSIWDQAMCFAFDICPSKGSGDGTGLNKGSGDGTGLNKGSGDGTGLNKGSGDGTGLNKGSGDGTGLSKGSGDGTGL